MDQVPGPNLRNTILSIGIVISFACLSLWGRSLWESAHWYDSDCVNQPSEACIEALRKSASWASPLNQSAKHALKDLQGIAQKTDNQFSALASEAVERSVASSRSILDRETPTLSHDLHSPWAIGSVILFFSWVCSALLMIKRGWNAEGRVVWANLIKHVTITIALIAGWVVCLVLA